MEQRPLRLGDIVDDYCPRERRITNHVIAALMGDTVQQTRCATCDVEHAYKGAKVPSRKKKEAPALETAVLASVNGTQLVARIDPVGKTDTPLAAPTDQAPGAAAPGAPQDSGDPASEPAEGLPGGWVGHRTLIRAALPRTDEPPPPRPIPEFTMYQRQARGSHGFRNGQGFQGPSRGPRGNFGPGGGGGNANGNEVNGNSFNYGGSGHRHGSDRGSNHSHRPPHSTNNGSNPVSNPGSNPGGSHAGPPGQGAGQGRPPGQGRRRHRHGKHRRPPQA